MAAATRLAMRMGQETEAAPFTSRQGRIGPLSPMLLAIVDDDDDVRVALTRLLKSMGHEVRVFSSGEEFAAAAIAVDCAIVDVRLPGLNGFELREYLRERVDSVPVVLITGDASRLDKKAARTVDTPLLSKPFDDVALMAAIADAMAQPESL